MRGMKVTVDAAMRARDVSRPHAEHEAAARAGEPAAGQVREEPAAAVLPAGPTGPGAPAAGPVGSAAAAPGRESKPGPGRQRRRRR
jgi:hypothetical protein